MARLTAEGASLRWQKPQTMNPCRKNSSDCWLPGRDISDWNAGSAVRGTFADLKACGAEPVAIGALLVLGSPASSFAADMNIVLESIASLPNALWEPSECPLCASGVPLEEVVDSPIDFTLDEASNNPTG